MLMLVYVFLKEPIVKAKTILLTITIVILMLSFGSGSAFADEGFKGLVHDGRWTLDRRH